VLGLLSTALISCLLRQTSPGVLFCKARGFIYTYIYICGFKLILWAALFQFCRTAFAASLANKQHNTRQTSGAHQLLAKFCKSQALPLLVAFPRRLLCSRKRPVPNKNFATDIRRRSSQAAGTPRPIVQIAATSLPTNSTDRENTTRETSIKRRRSCRVPRSNKPAQYFVSLQRRERSFCDLSSSVADNEATSHSLVRLPFAKFRALGHSQRKPCNLRSSEGSLKVRGWRDT
jgi:hypothetical protein